ETSVAKVTEKLLEPIKKVLTNPGSLRDKTLLSFIPTTCDAADVKLDDKLLELRKIGSPPMWKLFQHQSNAPRDKRPNVTELLNALNGRVIKDFPEPNATDAALGFDHPVAELSLYVNGIIPEEKKEEKKPEFKDKDAKKDEAKDKDAKKDEAKDKAKVE